MHKNYLEVMPCSQIDSYQRFGITCYFHLHGKRLKVDMENWSACEETEVWDQGPEPTNRSMENIVEYEAWVPILAPKCSFYNFPFLMCVYAYLTSYSFQVQI
jgi:hypothetical protein